MKFGSDMPVSVSYRPRGNVWASILRSAFVALATSPPLANRTALMTLGSMSGNISESAFSSSACLFTGRGGLAGGISVGSSENRTPGLGDLEGGGGAVALSPVAGASASSSKSSSRAVVGDSGIAPVFVV